VAGETLINDAPYSFYAAFAESESNNGADNNATNATKGNTFKKCAITE